MPTLPPIPGTPWFASRVRLLERKPTKTVAPPTPVPVKQPPITFGPPVPGAPWFLRALTNPRVRPNPRPAGGGPLPVPPGATSPIKPFVGRVPDVTSPQGQDRLRRSMDQLSGIVNSLIAQGMLVQTGPATWTIDASAISGTPADDDFDFLVGHGPPSPASGEAGDRYIDLDTGDFYWRD